MRQALRCALPRTRPPEGSTLGAGVAFRGGHRRSEAKEAHRRDTKGGSRGLPQQRCRLGKREVFRCPRGHRSPLGNDSHVGEGVPECVVIRQAPLYAHQLAPVQTDRRGTLQLECRVASHSLTPAPHRDRTRFAAPRHFHHMTLPPHPLAAEFLVPTRFALSVSALTSTPPPSTGMNRGTRWYSASSAARSRSAEPPVSRQLAFGPTQPTRAAVARLPPVGASPPSNAPRLRLRA